MKQERKGKERKEKEGMKKQRKKSHPDWKWRSKISLFAYDNSVYRKS